MKNKLIVFLGIFFLSFSSFSNFKPDDILVYSKTTTKWNRFLLDKIQQGIFNFGGEFNFWSFQSKGSQVVYDSSLLESMLNDETNAFLKKLESFSGLGILKIKPEFSLQNLGYYLHDISPTVKIKNSNDGVEIESKLKVDGIDIFASSFDINFVLPHPVNLKKMIALQVRLKNPQINFSKGILLPIDLSVKLSKVEEGFRLQLTELDFKNLASIMRKSVDLFKFDFSQLEFSDVSLEIMGRTIRVNRKKITEILEGHKDELKAIIINQIAAVIENNAFDSFSESIENKIIKNNIWLNTSLVQESQESFALFFKWKSLTMLDRETLIFRGSGDFCSKENFLKNGKLCLENKEFEANKNTITYKMNDTSVKEIENTLKGGANLLLSLSENYVTKLVHTTIAEGQWSEQLDELGIKLGKKKAFVKFDKKGGRVRLYIDSIYDVGRFHGIVLRNRYVNFPIVLELTPTIVNKEVVNQEEQSLEGVKEEKIPHIIFTLNDVLLEDNILRYGVPEYELHSSIQNIRRGLQWKVIQKIRKKMFEYNEESYRELETKWPGVELPGIAFPEIKNLNLENLEFYNDGLGRGNFFYMKSSL